MYNDPGSPSRISRGFGFVIFDDDTAAENALATKPHKVAGRAVRVSLSKKREDFQQGGQGESGGFRGRGRGGPRGGFGSRGGFGPRGGGRGGRMGGFDR